MALRGTKMNEDAGAGHHETGSAGDLVAGVRPPLRSVLLQVKLNIPPRPRTADQNITRRRRLNRLRAVINLSADHRTLACVTHPRAACPPYRDIERLGEFKQTPKFGVPPGRNSASHESNLRTRSLQRPASFRWLTSPADHARRERLTGPESLAMDMLTIHAPVMKPCLKCAEKTRRAAQIEIGFPGNPEARQRRDIQMTGNIEIVADLILSTRAAISDVPSAIRKLRQKPARFFDERMLVAIPCSINPPDCATGPLRLQLVKHRQQRRNPDSGAEQHHGPLARLQSEVSSWRADFDRIARLQPGMDKCAARAPSFPLYADPVDPFFRRSGERIVPQNRRLAVRRPNPDDDELPGQSRG